MGYLESIPMFNNLPVACGNAENASVTGRSAWVTCTRGKSHAHKLIRDAIPVPEQRKQKRADAVGLSVNLGSIPKPPVAMSQ